MSQLRPLPQTKNALPVRVMIVDDAVVVRGLVSRWVGLEPDMQVVRVCKNGREALEQFDIHRPASGLELLQRPVIPPGPDGSDDQAAVLAFQLEIKFARGRSGGRATRDRDLPADHIGQALVLPAGLNKESPNRRAGLGCDRRLGHPGGQP